MSDLARLAELLRRAQQSDDPKALEILAKARGQLATLMTESYGPEMAQHTAKTGHQAFVPAPADAPSIFVCEGCGHGIGGP